MMRKWSPRTTFIYLFLLSDDVVTRLNPIKPPKSYFLPPPSFFPVCRFLSINMNNTQERKERQTTTDLLFLNYYSFSSVLSIYSILSSSWFVSWEKAWILRGFVIGGVFDLFPLSGVVGVLGFVGNASFFFLDANDHSLLILHRVQEISRSM